MNSLTLEMAGSRQYHRRNETPEKFSHCEITTMPTTHEMYDEAIGLKRDGDLDGCVDKLLEVVAIDPNHSDAHSALAVFQQKLGHFDEAIEHAKKVVELMPNDAFAYTQLSVVLMRCGRIPEAEEAKAKAHMLQAGGCH